ncbi:penicillin-binding protein 1A [Martelella mediterranea]|uniref:Penicillin-binding protein 1A n=1 Tax=Martelella mediterranea TaxID=293089 RepID=A0A4R3P4G3_9HYPH|nr:penicillin-binding protein 1A [Martelella mediterranea]TCT43133.1 penicillin-binding protein 1A [Martelella mediterranea]
MSVIKFIGYLFGLACVLFLVVAIGVAVYLNNVAKDLPDYEVLAQYTPPVTTRMYASDGELMAQYAHERRLFLPIDAIPMRVRGAFLSAEDKNFYTHPGIDVVGLTRAVLTNVKNIGTGRRPVGASTITQQVAKNFLLSSDQTIERKVKEAILSFRIERAYSKDTILELYLNEVYFGLNAYGIADAALTYFDKPVSDLSVAESAYLAAVLKGPANYDPWRHPKAALERRNWVIDRMAENGYITQDEADLAKAEPLGAVTTHQNQPVAGDEYFAEAVRRELLDKYGEEMLYEGGLSVRTSLDPDIQADAQKALRDGLIKYDEAAGFRGPINQIDISGDWGIPLSKVSTLWDVPDWQVAVVLGVSADGVEIGLRPQIEAGGKVASERDTGFISADNMKWAYRFQERGKKNASSPEGVLKPGDVVYAEATGEGDNYRLRQVPKVQGGLVAMDPQTGRVVAMVGGFAFSQSQFNRATQAMRQPGSSFKPFVYAAALDNGYTPASVVMDAPIEIQSGGELWKPQNYGGSFSGPQTLRTGIEKSKNLMTVRLANDLGMDVVADYANNFGIYDNMDPVLAMALGSGETSVMRMVSAYAVIANGGKQVNPTLIDRIQNRYGETIFKHEDRICENCNAEDWQGQPEPILIDTRKQVLDPMTAYQVTSMMEGVVQRGTAARAVNLDRPVAGKTGTTNDEKDAWFVGFTPNLVAGLYVGFDQPATLGRHGTGGGLAAPIFNEFMQDALKNIPKENFIEPEGMMDIAVNRSTGMRATGSGPNVIVEAFKPGSGPAEALDIIDMPGYVPPAQILKDSNQANKAISTGSSGLY